MHNNWLYNVCEIVQVARFSRSIHGVAYSGVGSVHAISVCVVVGRVVWGSTMENRLRSKFHYKTAE